MIARILSLITKKSRTLDWDTKYASFMKWTVIGYTDPHLSSYWEETEHYLIRVFRFRLRFDKTDRT